MKTYLKHIRRSNGTLIGTVAVVDGEKNTCDAILDVGWSFCRKRLDQFSKARGRQIAINRAKKRKCGQKIPHSIEEPLREFVYKIIRIAGMKTARIYCDGFHYSIAYAEDF